MEPSVIPMETRHESERQITTTWRDPTEMEVRQEYPGGRIYWEEIDPTTNHGCRLWIRWRLNRNKTDQSGEMKHGKTFLVDDNPSSLSAGKATKNMSNLICPKIGVNKDASLFLPPL